MPRPDKDALLTRPGQRADGVPWARFLFASMTMIGDNLRHLWFGIPPASNVRGRQSGSMIVHLEVFTSWARHTSPLHRYAPYWTGMVCVGVSGRRSRSPLRIIGVNLCNLRFGIACVRSIRGQPSGSMLVHLEIFTTWARHASPLHRYAPDKTGTACRWRSMGIVSFVCRVRQD